MLAVAAQRFAVTFGTHSDDCGLQYREHQLLLLVQSLAALGVSVALFLSYGIKPDDRWQKRGVAALLVISSLVFLLIFTKHGLAEYATDC